MSKPVIFIGMMGCGKSYVSRALARKCNLDHYEMDEIIEKTQGMSISQIFEEYGQTHFRLLETELLVGLLQDRRPCVISGGGGVMGRAENMRAIRDLAISVWLKVDMPVLLERVKNGKGRPMLLQGGDPAKAMAELLEKREPLYASADIHIENNRYVDIDVLTDQIIDSIIEFQDAKKGK